MSGEGDSNRDGVQGSKRRYLQRSERSAVGTGGLGATTGSGSAQSTGGGGSGSAIGSGSVIFSDSFEDGNLDEYDVMEHDASPGGSPHVEGFTITTDASDGNYGVRHKTEKRALRPKDDVRLEPPVEVTIDCKFTFLSGVDFHLQWDSDKNLGYQVAVRSNYGPRDILEVAKLDEPFKKGPTGTTTKLKRGRTENAEFPLNSWFQLKIRWLEDGTIEAEIPSTGDQVSMQDDELSGHPFLIGGYHFDGTGHFDNVVIRDGVGSGDGVCAEASRFCDDWSDGDYTSSPPWEITASQGDFSVDVRTMSSVPTGGSNVLHVTETQGGGSWGGIGWKNEQTGWDTAWTLSGLFYTAAVPLSAGYQSHEVRAGGIKAYLGFTHPNRIRTHFALRGGPIDSVEESLDVDWAEQTWYHYEISHDGNGTYTGRLWEDGESRPSTPQARSTGSPPDPGPQAAEITINGAGGYALDINHAYMQWEEEAPEEDEEEEEAELVQGSATALTFIPGGSESSGQATNSAMPEFVDRMFHGDYRLTAQFDLERALEDKKYLPEYDSRRYDTAEYPKHRVRNTIEVEFSTDGETIELPDDPSFEDITENVSLSFADSSIAPVTLEGEEGENNPLRGVPGWFKGHEDIDEPWDVQASVPPETWNTAEMIEIDGIEGIRASHIFGSDDIYVRIMAERYWNYAIDEQFWLELGIDIWNLEDEVTFAAVLELSERIRKLPKMYTFLDMAVMADGSKVAKIWDASPYPRHSLYLGQSSGKGTKADASNFDFRGHWEPHEVFNVRFNQWASEVKTNGYPDRLHTLIGSVGPPRLYEATWNGGFGPHPVTVGVEPGGDLHRAELRGALSEPLFPWD